MSSDVDVVDQPDRPDRREPDVDGSRYMIGETYATKGYARFETKPGEGSGAGYERWRSYELRPETPGTRKEDVYVALHRLHYLLSDELIDVPIGEALRSLEGCDIHHQNGVKWDNRIENLERLEHGQHSSITNTPSEAEQLAFAKDRKREIERQNEQRLGADRCPACGTETETLATSPGFDGERCLDCAMTEADGATINL